MRPPPALTKAGSRNDSGNNNNNNNSSSSTGVAPLSPPLTPHPPMRFPHMPFIPHFLLAAQAQAQYNPLLAAEQIQKLVQVQLHQAAAAVNAAQQQQQQLENGSPEKRKQDSPFKHPVDEEDLLKKPSETGDVLKTDDLKRREEEMLEDEMKEEEEKEKSAAAASAAANSDKKEDSNMAPFHVQARLAMMRILSNANNANVQSDGSSSGGGPCDYSCQHNCGKSFSSFMDLFSHQESCPDKDKLNNSSFGEDWNQNNSVHYEESLNSEGGCDQDSQDGMNSRLSNGTSPAQRTAEEERKVRVRTLISEEQLSVLKTFYKVNPRPKREELERIASQIGHPFKVVKVWFQNSRARDRREGKPPGNPLGVMPFLSGSAAGQLLNVGRQINSADFMANSSGGVNNNQPASQQQFMAALQAGVFPRLPMLPGLAKAANGFSDGDQGTDANRADDTKSPASTTGGDSDCPEIQPLDLSNKSSSPSVSPVSSLNRSSPPPIMDQAMRMRFPFAFPPAGFGPVGFPGAIPPAAPGDIYRFQEEFDSLATGEEEGSFPCSKCDKTFNKKSSLQRHKFEHSG